MLKIPYPSVIRLFTPNDQGDVGWYRLRQARRRYVFLCLVLLWHLFVMSFIVMSLLGMLLIVTLSIACMETGAGEFAARGTLIKATNNPVSLRDRPLGVL